MSRSEQIAQALGEYRVHHSLFDGSDTFIVNTGTYEFHISEYDPYRNPWVYAWNPSGQPVFLLSSYLDEDTIRMLKGLIGDG